MPSDNPLADAPQWKQLCERAILELDPNKLSERIADARGAILDRVEDAPIYSLRADEIQAMNAALSTLRLLQDVTTTEKRASISLKVDAA